MGGQSGRNIDILGVFGRIFLDTLFSIDVRVIFEKTDEEKHMKFRLFFNRLFFYMFAEIAVFHNAGILKISDFPWGKHYFYKISIFAIDGRGVENELKNNGLGGRTGLKRQKP